MTFVSFKGDYCVAGIFNVTGEQVNKSLDDDLYLTSPLFASDTVRQLDEERVKEIGKQGGKGRKEKGHQRQRQKESKKKT